MGAGRGKSKIRNRRWGLRQSHRWRARGGGGYRASAWSLPGQCAGKGCPRVGDREQVSTLQHAGEGAGVGPTLLPQFGEIWFVSSALEGFSCLHSSSARSLSLQRLMLGESSVVLTGSHTAQHAAALGWVGAGVWIVQCPSTVKQGCEEGSCPSQTFSAQGTVCAY